MQFPPCLNTHTYETLQSIYNSSRSVQNIWCNGQGRKLYILRRHFNTVTQRACNSTTNSHPTAPTWPTATLRKSSQGTSVPLPSGSVLSDNSWTWQLSSHLRSRHFCTEPSSNKERRCRCKRLLKEPNKAVRIDRSANDRFSGATGTGERSHVVYLQSSEVTKMMQKSVKTRTQYLQNTQETNKNSSSIIELLKSLLCSSAECNEARWRIRVVVRPCVACSLRPRFALAPELIYFAHLSITMKQDWIQRSIEQDNTTNADLNMPKRFTLGNFLATHESLVMFCYTPPGPNLAVSTLLHFNVSNVRQFLSYLCMLRHMHRTWSCTRTCDYLKRADFVWRIRRS